MKTSYITKIALAILFIMLCSTAQSQTFEAEAGETSNCTIVTDTRYSGKKAVRMTEENSSLTLNIDIAKRQKFSIFIAADGIGGNKEVKCSINGAATIFITGNYGEVEIGSFFLNEGTNKIVISPSWTWFNIDYVRIEECDHSSDITFDIAAVPVTADATPSAKALYTFLKDNFGKRTIAGMMTGSMDGSNGQNIKSHEDVAAVYKVSGRYPALVGFDFMNTTGIKTDMGDGWYKSYADKVMSLAKETWRKGGIPDFTWHWRDPSRKTENFYADQVTFDYTSAINSDGTWDTSSNLYKNMVKDIDIIADCFLDLQRSGMACIFRPLHEAPGGWFWWGAKGAEPYKQLYRLIYDEIVNVKGVRCVIWDWNTDSNIGYKWCPGSEYYDIASVDIYNEKFDYSSNYPTFDKMKALTGGKKIIALAENGPLPDIEAQDADNAMWSWWMPWYQSWNGGFVNLTSESQWKKCMTDSRTITLEDMPGWDTLTSLCPVSSDDAITPSIYNLMGIQLANTDHLSSGIYIIDGRKTYLSRQRFASH